MHRVIKSTNQSNQENFVIFCSNFKLSGHYLEIGASDGVSINNTFVLENSLGWKGVGVELDSEQCRLYNVNRQNECIQADATIIDYSDLLDSMHFPQVIDYLQVDIEPAHQSLEALKRVMETNRVFSFITFEHDLYINPNNRMIKTEAHDLLQVSGYKRVISDVEYDGMQFEDWYVHSSSYNFFTLLSFKLLLFTKLLEPYIFLVNFLKKDK